MSTRNIAKRAFPSRPFRAADQLRSDVELAAYVRDMLVDGDARAVPVVLRTLVEAVGGVAALADKTRLSHGVLSGSVSERRAPRFNTVAVILAAFGLRLTAQPSQKPRSRRSKPRTSVT